MRTCQILLLDYKSNNPATIIVVFFVVLCEVFVAEVRILGTFNLSVVNSGFYAISSLFWCEQCLIPYFL